MTIPLTVALVHQHVFRERGGVVGTFPYAIGMIRLVADEFAHALNVAPLMDADGADAADFQALPANIEQRTLYRRAIATPRWRVALLHAASVPAIVAAVRTADVVQARLPSYPGLIAGALAAATGKPLVVSIHGDLGRILRLGGGLAGRVGASVVDALQRWTTRRSRVVLITGDQLRHLVGRGVEPVLFANHQIEEGHLFRREDTCRGPRIRLLFVGRLSREKGVDVLLDAMTRLPAHVELVLVGARVAWNVDAEVVRRGLGARVTVRGPVAWGPPLFAEYRAADVLVFPSRSEGAPKVPLEAMSQGLPVVATTPGTSSYLRDRVHGLLVPPGDVDALSAAIARMIDDGALRRGCIAAGLALAHEHSRDRMRARIAAALDAAFGAGR